MAFPDGFVEEVRRASDIVRYISEHVALKKAGSSWKGLCPFHQEKTPSFNVRSEPPAFHCFGCGEGGDIFRFVMLQERVGFPEAVAHVARRFGIAIPRIEDEAQASQRRQLLTIIEAAAGHFSRNLWGSVGSKAREYLLSRGFERSTLERIRAGAAAASWDDLIRHLGRRFSVLQLQTTGLILERQDKKGHYDRFRNRAIFPILNESDRVVGFGARSLDASEPKYLNTPETPVYQKARLLYGLSWAKEAIRRTGRVVLMEGYLDVARAIEAGVAETVATCGTALTSAHARLLRRFSNRVIVNFDQDVAGQRAAERSIDALVAEGLEVQVVELPPEHDPDSFLRSEGVDAYRQRLERSLPYVEWLIKRAALTHDVRTPAGKRDFLNAVLPTLSRIENSVERAAWLPVLTSRGQLDEAAVRAELHRALGARASRVSTEKVVGDETQVFLPVERLFLACLLRNAAGSEEALGEIDDADIEGLASATILRAARRLLQAGAPLSLAALSEAVDDRGRRLLNALAVGDSPAGDQGPRECARELRRRTLVRRLDQIQERISQASEGEIEELLQAKQDLIRHMRET